MAQRQTKRTLGQLNELTVAEARAKAASLVLAGKENRDLVGDAKRAAENDVTLEAVWLQYRESLERRKCSPLSIALNDGVWRLRLAKHGSKALSSITKSDCRAWHHGWRDSGPTAANRAARLLSTLFHYAEKKTSAAVVGNPVNAVDFYPERLKSSGAAL